MNRQRTNIYIHIGWPKTGTKTIQYGLVENDSLLSRRGYHYPISSRKPRVNHQNIAFQLLNDPRYNPNFGSIADLVSEINNTILENIIISSEVLINLDSNQIEELRHHFSSFENIQIIAYLRRQDLWFASRWSEGIKTGKHTEDFVTYTRKRFQNKDYYEILKKWSDVFGQNNIVLHILENAQLIGHLFYDFLNACKVQEVSEFSIPKSVNVSPTQKELEILRFIFKKLNIKHYPGLVPGLFFQKAIRTYAQNNGWDISTHPNVVSKKMHDEIEERYRDCNRRIARDYFQREKLFLESYEEKPLTTFNVSKLSKQEVLELTSFLLRQLLAWFEDKQRSHNQDFEHMSLLLTENSRVREEYNSMCNSRGWKLIQSYRQIRRRIFDTFHFF